jgi:hypothetical protein
MSKKKLSFTTSVVYLEKRESRGEYQSCIGAKGYLNLKFMMYKKKKKKMNE